MYRAQRLWRAMALVGTAGLGLAACGGSSGGNVSAGQSPTAPSSSSSSSASPSPAPTKANTGDGVFTVGTLLPQTGNLAFLGPPEFAGVDLAVKTINDAGGVLGKPVKQLPAGDSGDTSTNIATQTATRLINNSADVIIGAASSGVSFTVIDQITGSGIVQISPANTSPKFTDYNDKGLYFRTAPSDVLQGRIDGDLIASDGNATLGILALQDPYGEGLADNVEKSFTSQGGQVVAKVIYDPQAPNYDAEVQKVKAADPAAIILIGFDESARIIKTLVAQGIGPQQGKKLYLVDGNTGNALGEQLPPGTLKGVQGSIPGAKTSDDFKQELKTVNSGLKDFSYAPESYDAVIIAALAAEKAKTDKPTEWAKELPGITKDGTKCTTFADCKKLIDQGKDIDYDGRSGPIELSDKGDPQQAFVGIYTFGADNKLQSDVTFREGKI